MRAGLWVILSAVLVAANAEDYKYYDSAALKRFDDELRSLGIVLPSLSEPDEPMVNRSDPLVSSPAGDFEGYWTKSQFGRPIAAFEGIPYAQPPVGPLRFKVAQPLAARLTNFKAKSPRAICTQRIGTPGAGFEGSEDCLFVNVYTPEETERPKSELFPVMVWVHGGGWAGDAGDSFQPNILLDRDIVLVTFNYRLGALGFLTTEDEVIPGNLGLKDQVQAFKWTRENIAAFGGNPDLITAFGESAGGASVDFLMLSPLARGLLHRAIAMSGSAFASWALAPPGEMRENVRKAAQHLQCPDEPSQLLWECLQNKTGEEINGVDDLFDGEPVVFPYKPVIEGDVPGAHIPHHPSKLFADGLANDVPYIAGVTSDEGLWTANDMFQNDTIIREFDENYLEYWPKAFLLTPSQSSPRIVEAIRRAYLSPGPLNKSNIYEMVTLVGDIFFLWPAVESAQHHKNVSKESSYLYYFNFEGSRSFVPKYRGVCHADDILYLFNYTTTLFTPPTPRDVLMSVVWTEMFTSFARDGVPSSNITITQWEPISTEGSDVEYLHVKSPTDLPMKKGMRAERWLLLKTLFERA